jgi:alpha-L-fucosidase 2
MTEMLLQSQSNEIYLLPALPDAWAAGEINGLKARGNFEVGMQWKNKKIVKASILSVVGGNCVIRTNQPIKIAGVQAKSKETDHGYLTSFLSKKGARYLISSTAL